MGQYSMQITPLSGSVFGANQQAFYRLPIFNCWLASPCPAVDSFTSASWDDLMKGYLKLVIQYSECAGKNAAVSDAQK